MGEIPDRAFHCGEVARINGTQVDAERRRNGLNGSKFTDAGEFARIANDRYTRDVRRDLLEEFQPFPADTVFKQQEAGRVTARP